MTSAKWQNDNGYEEYAIQKVDLVRDGSKRGTWVVSLEFGFSLQWLRGAGIPQPKVDQVVRVYGDIEDRFGPRGVIIEDRAVYFRTVAEHAEWVQQCADVVYRDATELFEQHKEALHARLKLLPTYFQDQIAVARAASESGIQFDVFELGNEIAKHEYAHMLALVVDSEATLETFSLIPNQGQMKYSWHALCDDRLETIEKMLKVSSAAENILAQLRQEVQFIDRYKEQQGVMQHSFTVTPEVFSLVVEFMQAAPHP